MLESKTHRGLKMICLRCKEKEVKYIKRGLCDSCYQCLYAKGDLELFPQDHKRWIDFSYSKDFQEDVEKLFTDDSLTLNAVGMKHGCTREWIRQAFENIYGFKYSVIVKKRISEQKTKNEYEKMLHKDPRYKVLTYKPGNISKGACAEEKVLEICHKLGYSVAPFIQGMSIDLVVNKFNVEVKSAYSTVFTSDTGRTGLFHFACSIEQMKVADFVACYAEPINKFFVIPIAEFPKGRSLYIPEKPMVEWNGSKNSHQVRKSKWYQYLEAWHLLKQPQPEITFNRLLAAQAAHNSIPRAVNAPAEDRAGLAAVS